MLIRSVTSYGTRMGKCYLPIKTMRTTDFGKYKDKYITVDKFYENDKLVNKRFVVWNDIMQVIKNKFPKK